MHAPAGPAQASRGVWAACWADQRSCGGGGRKRAGQRAADTCVYVSVCVFICACARAHVCVPSPRARGEQCSGRFAGGSLRRTRRFPRDPCLSPAPGQGCSSLRLHGRRVRFGFLPPAPEAFPIAGAIESGPPGPVPEVVGFGSERSPHRGGRLCSVAVPAASHFFFFFCE